MQKKTKKIIILTILLLITILIIFLLTQNTNKQIPQPLNEQAKAQYETIIGDQTYDITNAVLEPNEIVPTISAGMIPIKWNGTNWEITTRNDTNWYNYANGKPAYIMLNDGYYKSEIEQGVANEQLMENAVGNDALVVPNITDNNPTIYMYIPRFAYNTQGKILYIKQSHSVAGTYTLPEIFTYETEKRDFSLAGIWVEYNPLVNTKAVDTKINNMQGPNNKYGFIANTKGTNANNETSYQTTIETYNQHIANIVNGTTGASFPTDSTTDTNTVGAPLEGIPEGHDTAVPITITDISNKNRTILKIVNTNQPEPIKAKAYYDETEEKIKIEVNYRTNAITKILNSKGNILSENSTTADSGDEIIGNGIYKYIAIDSEGNIKEINTKVEGLKIYIIPDLETLKQFRDEVNAGNDFSGITVIQTADIAMNEGKYEIDSETGDITFSKNAEQWEPIGYDKYFKGEYNGQGYTISGVYVNSTANGIGLFGSGSNCTIQGIKLVDSSIKGNQYVGGIIGSIEGTESNVNNCGNYAQVNATYGYAGGIVGNIDIADATTANITNSYNCAKILGGYYIGGIVGYGYSIKGRVEVKQCYNKGIIEATSSGAGGIAGFTAHCNVTYCYNIGRINSIGGDSGGIVGMNYSNIYNCYNVGNISSEWYRVGGIVRLQWLLEIRIFKYK